MGSPVGVLAAIARNDRRQSVKHFRFLLADFRNLAGRFLDPIGRFLTGRHPGLRFWPLQDGGIRLGQICRRLESAVERPNRLEACVHHDCQHRDFCLFRVDQRCLGFLKADISDLNATAYTV
jgi:hypothetical protein